MKFKTYIILFLLFLTSCDKKNKPEKSDIRNIEQISTDKPIVGDFDRKKYPILQNAILLKLDSKFEKSITEFNKAEKIYGEMIQIYLNRGVVYEQVGKIKNAESDFTNCIKIDSNYFPALLNRGLIYTHSGKIEKALSDFNKVIELNPNEPASYLNRAVTYRKIGNTELACADLKKANELGISEKYNSNMTSEMINELKCDK
ncbi:tetratricopeptide repeat protein [Tenacibaculum finnmarkense]|uniref:tetratricopeptide repeat protein n=1 Tax=Tenacibaculum finnmarkense TaxID=2781243 RepID=UPI001EFB39A3|nr:tetratricopeptide repeat protein [Tenacibaculum finnmarkense]MCG8786428.1 tetratricopeptide repeat protein [Tenacibaculum finnmarkense]MCG8814053.1 tetratricopeptide repeat protein [Tenacibaculum finnmarkense]